MTSRQLSEAQAAFRAAMANLSAAVNIVTTNGSAGRAGITVSAVCSVTDDPPTLVVCINKSSYAHDFFRDNGYVCVNVLGASHEELAMQFAGRGDTPMAERLAAPIWDHETEGVPVLRDAVASVVGRVTGKHAHGSHTVMFVEVYSVQIRETSGGLVYFQRRFHGLGGEVRTSA